MIKKYERCLSIISAIFISLSSIGFIILPFVFENEISRLKEENSEIINSQKTVYDFILQSNSSKEKYYNQKDHIDILSSITNNVEMLNKKKATLLFHQISAASFSLSAAISIKKITKAEYDQEFKKLTKLKSYDEIQSVNNKYEDIASKATTELDKKRIENNKSIEGNTQLKNKLWYLSIVFQSIGMIIAVLIIGAKNKA